MTSQPARPSPWKSPEETIKQLKSGWQRGGDIQRSVTEDRYLDRLGRPKDWYTWRLTCMLLDRYNANQECLSELSVLGGQHAKVPSPAALDVFKEWEIIRQQPSHRDYHTDVERFAKNWGLRASWGKPAVHQALADSRNLALPQPLFQHLTTFWSRPPNFRGAVDIEWDPRSETWSAAEHRLLQEARRQRAEYEDEHGQAFEHPRELSRHVHMLYQRIAPGRRQSWMSIAEDFNADERTVRSAVNPNMERLGLEQPKLRVGRPPKT